MWFCFEVRVTVLWYWRVLPVDCLPVSVVFAEDCVDAVGGLAVVAEVFCQHPLKGGPGTMIFDDLMGCFCGLSGVGFRQYEGNDFGFREDAAIVFDEDKVFGEDGIHGSFISVEHGGEGLIVGGFEGLIFRGTCGEFLGSAY